MLYLATLSFVSGCHSHSAEATRYIITGHGTDKPDPICKADLTPEDVKVFFTKAKPMTQKTMHDEYDYMPCWVEGKTISSGGTSTWRIHPIGVGEITLPDNTHQLLGCNTCDEQFR